MKLNGSGVCPLCVYRIEKGIDVTAPGLPNGVRIPRTNEPGTTRPVVNPAIEEITMTTKNKTTPRGTCPICKREDVLLPGPKCFRCYDRIKRGVDVITGLPIPPLRAHDLEKTAKAPVAPKPSLAILADNDLDDGPPLPPVRPAKHQPAPPTDYGVKLDIADIIDGLWLEKRTAMLRLLSAAPNECERLDMAQMFVHRIKSIGF
jgi:hypothetical protein